MAADTKFVARWITKICVIKVEVIFGARTLKDRSMELYAQSTSARVATSRATIAPFATVAA